MYEAYKLLYELIQLVCGGDFQEIFALLTLYVEISNKNHRKIILSQGRIETSAVPLAGISPVAGIGQIPARLFLLLKCLKRG
jgi:hypothetical protein